MQNVFFILLISVLAGFFTLFGCFFTFGGSKSSRMISFALSFAGGIMIGVCFSDLLPNALSVFIAINGKAGILMLILFLLTGVIFAKFIDNWIHHKLEQNRKNLPAHDLYKTGVVSLIAILLHKFPEGIALFAAGSQNITLGITIALAIAVHNFPEGIAIAVPIYYATGSRLKAFRYTFFAAVAEPFGVILAASLLRPFINPFLMGTIFSFVVGVMLCISFDELLPSAGEYGHKNIGLAGLFLGISLMLLSDIFI
ncbi:MAG: hypothetical protein BGN88_11720 [Clostridiales bacterium 43-6]|nr:MAG: hypothetical protein BGN88_11720 [Clostridiales bacterium 43-6]